MLGIHHVYDYPKTSEEINNGSITGTWGHRKVEVGRDRRIFNLKAQPLTQHKVNCKAKAGSPGLDLFVLDNSQD